MKIEKLLEDLSADKQTTKPAPKCPFSKENGLKLTNFEAGSQSVDTLHTLSMPIKCTEESCKGALMAGQSYAPVSRSKEETLEHAYSFQQQYQASLKTSTEEDFRNRLNEIKKEVNETGTYYMTFEELLFAAKLAWRNAARCIGRIQWKNLDVLDYRHVKTTREMYEGLCKHLEHATNGGNIRSTLTVFPHRVPDREDFRLWNPQLINFAGYLKEDGTVIGDPGRLHLTRICQRLGWKGKGGQFDVLPWIVSAPGEGAKFYEIPEELVLLVDLEHPKYTWFSELGLKWYAVPAVADMMFDAGGLCFTAAPFNGWYMATEVGARNLCDAQRYNLSKEIAERMGLDTSTPTTLWKDQALIEATRAALYSYQKNKVTIVDHHTAADTFMQHMETEQKLRGGCPADWVWIVPPISGSATPVFHQEMIIYNLKPAYEYQSKAWISYQWPKNDQIQLKYSFATLAKVVKLSLGMASKMNSTRVQATILFATETGKSQKFAKRLETVLRSSFSTRVLCMEDYDTSELQNETLVIIVASTFGSGEAPDNGKDFWSSLKSMNKNKVCLKDLRYAVFGLGSSQYPDFCNFGKNLDNCLAEMQAKRVTTLEMGDELRGQEHTFNIWIPAIYHASCDEFKLEASEDITPELSVNTWKEGMFRCVPAETKETDFLKGLSKLHNKNLISLKMSVRSKLQPNYSERQTLLIQLKAKDAAKLNYQPGDHVAIFPTNPENVVNDIIDKIEPSGYDKSDVIITENLQQDSKWTKYDRLPEATLHTCLNRYLDITSPPTSNLLYLLSTLAANPWDKYRLKRLSEVSEDYEEWKNFRYPHLAELLEEFPSIKLDPTLLLSELPLLQPRFYSISSSKVVSPDEVHITVALHSYRTQDNKGPIHHGVCTAFLNNISEDDVLCFVRSAPKFHLPEDTRAPVIMVGAGSGIAPFRSFWIEREDQVAKSKNDVAKAAFGPMYLFFGCRQSTVDNIYEHETAALVEKGVMTGVYTAFSRKPGQAKQYVQHKLKEESKLVASVIAKNGHIYVCGDAIMAADIRSTVENILKENDSPINLETLTESGRYHEDVFGVLHKR